MNDSTARPRACMDCGTDISRIPTAAKRCAECAIEVKRVKAREYYHRKKRGEVDLAPRPDSPCPCGATIDRSGSGGYRRKYCSKRCAEREKWRNRAGSYDRFNEKPCATCGEIFYEEIRPGYPNRFCRSCRPRNITPRRTELRRVNCKRCGVEFEHPRRLYCDDCPRRSTSGPKYRHSPEYKNLRRRVLAEEPNCWICGEHIDHDFKFPHPKSPCMDHVVPVSVDMSLLLERSNVHAAHLECNQHRDDGRNSSQKTIDALRAEVADLRRQLEECTCQTQLTLISVPA